MVDNITSTIEQTNSFHEDKTAITNSTSSTLLSNFDDETKTRILSLLKELSDTNNSASQMDYSSAAKLAFVNKNLYVCSTCSGPVQWV